MFKSTSFIYIYTIKWKKKIHLRIFVFHLLHLFCIVDFGDNKWSGCWSQHHHNTRYPLFCAHNKGLTHLWRHPLCFSFFRSLSSSTAAAGCCWIKLQVTDDEESRFYFFILIRFSFLLSHSGSIQTLSVPLPAQPARLYLRTWCALRVSIHPSTSRSAPKRARAKRAHWETKKDVINMCTGKAIKKKSIIL